MSTLPNIVVGHIVSSSKYFSRRRKPSIYLNALTKYSKLYNVMFFFSCYHSNLLMISLVLFLFILHLNDNIVQLNDKCCYTNIMDESTYTDSLKLRNTENNTSMNHSHWKLLYVQSPVYSLSVIGYQLSSNLLPEIL